MLLSSILVLSTAFLATTTKAAPIPMKQPRPNTNVARSFQPWEDIAGPLPARATSAEPPEHTSPPKNKKKHGDDDNGGGGAGWPKSTNAQTEQASFGIKGDISKFLKEHEGSPVLDGHYTEGSYAGAKTPPDGPGIAGFIVDGNGGDSVGITNGKKVSFKYKVMFEAGFEFALAGKLPGMFGGDSAAVAGKCAGGNHNDECWSARLMWREQGKGELYGYWPTTNKGNRKACGDNNEKCTVKYGASVGTGAWSFEPGKWTDIEQIITLNDFNQKNGEIIVKVGGETKITVPDMELRTSEEGRIQGAMIHTFFGGSSKPDYASPKDQHAYFKDFSFTVLEKISG